MSRATLQRLEQLLSRVQERRTAPRMASASLLAVVEARTTQAPGQPFSAPPPNTGRISKAPTPTPLEESMEQLVPVERPRETQPNPFEAKPMQAPQAPPDSEDLFLDDFEPPPTIVPPPAARIAAPTPAAAPTPMSVPVPAPAAPAAVSAPAPAFRAEPLAMPAAPAPITSATARIVPAAPMGAASPVAAISMARSIEPKSFGELLDLSLALRPQK